MPRFSYISCLLLSLFMLSVETVYAQPIPVSDNLARQASSADASTNADPKRPDITEPGDAFSEQADQLWAVFLGNSSAHILKPEKIQAADTKVTTNAFSEMARSRLLAPMLQSTANQYGLNLSMRSRSLLNQTLIGSASNNTTALIAMLARTKIVSTYMWAVPGSTASVIVPENPTFEVHYDEIPGVNPNDFQPVILKLTATSNNWRRVGETRAKVEASGQPSQATEFSSFVENRVPAQVTMLGKGQARITVAHLTAGEYALTLRPLSQVRIAASDIVSNHGNWLVLGHVWAFAVK